MAENMINNEGFVEDPPNKGDSGGSNLWSYKQVVVQALPRLVLISVLLSLGAFVAIKKIGPTYQLHYSYLIALKDREAAPEYRFDGYYAISATELFAQTLAAWIKTPETIVAAYRAADLPLPTSDSSQLIRSITVDKQAPQLVSVTISQSNPDTAQKLAAGLQTVMQRNIDRYQNEGVPALRFQVIASEPWLGETKISAAVIVPAVFIFTLFFGINWVILISSLKHS